MSKNILTGTTVKQNINFRSLGRIFFESAEQHENKIAQIYAPTDQSDTYKTIKQRSANLAIELDKRGITNEDVIAFCSEHSLDCIIPILATLYLGAKVANLDPQLSPRQTQHLLSLVNPKMIFVQEKSLTLIEENLLLVDLKSEVIVHGESHKHQTLDDLLKNSDDDVNKFKPKDVNVDDTAITFFTSGTTGLPKGICHTHRTFYYIIMSSREWKGYNSEIVFCASSLYWLTLMTYLLSCFIDGGCRILSNDLEPQNVLKIIEKYKVTSIFLSPSMTYRITNLENAKNFDTASLLVLQSGGAVLSVAQLNRIKNLFKHSKILVGYGMSEIGGIAGFPPEQGLQIMLQKPGSVGMLCPGIVAKVVDMDDGSSILGANQAGEFFAKSTSLMTGYYKVDNSDVFDAYGFIKTGDIGYYDEDGYFYIIERMKEMLKYKTGHVMPSFIESVLMEHPAVKDAAVIGVLTEEEGEIPAACVVLKDGFIVSESDIEEFIARKVTDRDRLRGGVRFVDHLQRTPTGKLMRKEIKECMIDFFSVT